MLDHSLASPRAQNLLSPSLMPLTLHDSNRRAKANVAYYLVFEQNASITVIVKYLLFTRHICFDIRSHLLKIVSEFRIIFDFGPFTRRKR